MAHYLFVTGRLAEQPLRRVLQSLAPQVGFDYSVAVMPITIAALITPRWLARRLEVPEGVTAVVVPGHCTGDLSALQEIAGVPVERGPRDLRELPAYYGRKNETAEYGDWDIEILAKISGADALSPGEIVGRASALADDGADVVVLEGSGRPWPGLASIVEELREEARRVAVADVAPLDLLAAVRNGIELVFPADAEQQEAAVGLRCEIVLQAGGAAEVDFRRRVEEATGHGIRFRIDPGLQPIGMGLASCLGRYLQARQRWPAAPKLMCLDTITETTAIDTAALSVLFMGLCQELGVGSVLVSQDSNWSRTAVRECRLARQVSRCVARRKSPARDVEPGLLVLRDAAALEFGPEELGHLSEVLKDPSPRLFAEGGKLHAVMPGKHLESDDPYDLFDQMMARCDTAFEPERAFYYGYEMAKAMTALTLGKTYRQDEALNWGMLTRRD